MLQSFIPFLGISLRLVCFVYNQDTDLSITKVKKELSLDYLRDIQRTGGSIFRLTDLR